MTNLAAGPHEIYVKCLDEKGNVNPDDFIISFSIAQEAADTEPPTISISSPVSLTPPLGVRGSVLIRASAADNKGVTRVQFRIDGTELGIKTAAPFEINFDSSRYTAGSHVMTAVALDAAENQRESAPLAVLIADQTPPPAPTISAGSAVSKTQISISWPPVADDGGGRVSYELYRNGALIIIVPAGTYTDSNLLPGTEYSYRLKASDEAENKSALSNAALVTTLKDPPRFSLTDKIVTADSAAVYEEASKQSDTVGEVGSGVQGAILANAWTEGAYWWKVSFTGGLSGWVEDSVLNLFVAAPANVTLTFAGRTGLAVAPWPQTSLFESKTETITVKYSGTGEASNLEIAGLAGPFSFKGGAYPGAGGSCKATIGADCALTIEFTPRLQPEINSYFTPVTIRYKSGIETREQKFWFQAKSNPVGDIYISSGWDRDLVNFGLSYLGSTVKRSVVLGTTVSGSELKIIDISPVASSYTANSEKCKGVILKSGGPDAVACTFDLNFKPENPGDDNKTFIVTYDNALETKTRTAAVRGRGWKPSAENVLAVYNTNSADSIAVKNYYLANRPGIAGINILGVAVESPAGCTANCDPNPEIVSETVFKTKIREPVASWLQANPGKDVRYIILFYGLPTRFIEASGLDSSVEYHLSDAFLALGQRDGYTYPAPATGYRAGYFDPADYPGTTALVAHIAMGSVADTLAYIDKLKTAHQRMPNPDTVISGRKAGLGGSTYYLAYGQSGSYIGDSQIENQQGALIRDALRLVNPEVSFVYDTEKSPSITRGSNVTGYFTWGFNGGLSADYAVDGTLKFSGNSGWYILQTGESWNGHRSTWQGNFVEWFAKGAFGGVNYENTPVGAVAHTNEPQGPGINRAQYFSCFEEGQLFADCAWWSRNTPFFMAVGDPLVTR